MIKLTPKREKFCQLMATQKISQSDAYRKAFDAKNMSAAAIHVNACQLMKDTKVALRLEELKMRVVERAELDGAALVKQLASIVLADPNDLSQLRRVNCRFCNGTDHAYQWKHKGEFHQKLESWEERKAAHEEKNHKTGKNIRFKEEMPSDAGGFGFKANADPHPDCPECLGEGIDEIFLQDTRKLTGHAKALYAGVKQTKHGIEILTHSQDGARRMLGEHFGVFKTIVESTNKNENVNATVNIDTKDPVEAAKAYQKLMGG